MAVDFIQDYVTYQTRREYEQITDFNDFIGLEETFTADTSMGLTEKNVSGMSFKGVKKIMYDGKEVGKVTVESKYPGHYPNLMNRVNTSFAENAIDDGATAVLVPEECNWKMTLSGKTAAGDPFNLRIDDSYAVLSGFHLEATQQTIETWCDSQSELSTAPTA